MQINNSKITINKSTYLILTTLSRGAFGIILKGQNEQTNQIVAIKQQKEINENELQMLTKMKKQNFKNLINILELEYIDGKYSMVMEYWEESLSDRLENKGTIKPDDIRYIMKEIANGLKEIHDLNYAHRDLKPDNVMILQIHDINGNSQEIYKLFDFCTIKEIDLLQTQQVGTLYYQAPEQLNNSGQYTQKIDVWAFGVMIYELMTNDKMFKGYYEDHIQQKILETTQQEINTIINTNIRLERKYKTLLLNMLQVDPNKRYDIQQIISYMKGNSKSVSRQTTHDFLFSPSPKAQVQQNNQFNYNKDNFFGTSPKVFNQENEQQQTKSQRNINNEKKKIIKEICQGFKQITLDNFVDNNIIRKTNQFRNQANMEIPVNQNWQNSQDSMHQKQRLYQIQGQPFGIQQQSSNTQNNQDTSVGDLQEFQNTKNIQDKLQVNEQQSQNTQIAQNFQDTSVNNQQQSQKIQDTSQKKLKYSLANQDAQDEQVSSQKQSQNTKNTLVISPTNNSPQNYNLKYRKTSKNQVKRQSNQQQSNNPKNTQLKLGDDQKYPEQYFRQGLNQKKKVQQQDNYIDKSLASLLYSNQHYFSKRTQSIQKKTQPLTNQILSSSNQRKNNFKK